MTYVTPIYGGSAAQIDYRLGITQHGCSSDAQFRYRADARERPLRWIGRGLSALGVDGLAAGAELTTEQHDLARALMAGRHPGTGEQLVAPKLAVPADAKVPLGPLVAAVEAAAVERGVADLVELFATPKQRSGWGTAARAVARRGDAALLRVDEALALAEAAGLDAEQVWPTVDLIETYSNLFEPTMAVDEHGKAVLDKSGLPKLELAPRRVPVGIVGYDIGITLPKSLSLLLAFLPDELADRVEARYTAAIERTFGWTEDRTSYVRRGKHGAGHTARQEASSGLSGWVMTHRAARPVGDAPVGDPHWHVHITIANLAQAPDETWLTIGAGGRELMRHAPAIDKVTQAEVRRALHAELGITFTRSQRTGLWEVAHIPDEAITYFSKRGHQVNAVLAQLGYSNADTSAAEARMLTRNSRSAKSETTAESDATLRELWRADAILGAGIDPDALMDRVLAGYRAGATSAGAAANTTLEARFGIGLDELVATLTDPEHGLTAHARRFSHLDAIAAVADALPYGAAVEDVERLVDLALAHPNFIPLSTGAELLGGPGARTQLAGAHQMTGGHLFTTRDVTAAEHTILSAAATDAQACAVVPPATVDMSVTVVEAAQGFALSAEQRDVLHRVVSNGRAVEAIEGPPGTGKTTLMRAARVAWEAAGYRVAGAATAAVAAQNLAAESGIASRTVAQWLWQIENRAGLSGLDVLVLDEANLTSDRDRAALYTAAAAAGTKIVEVGDARQLRGVGCGSLFGYLHRLLDGPRLTENRRQRQADERAALAAFRDGRHAEALHTWARLGGVVATETADEAVAEMVAAWLRLRAGAPDPHTQTAGLLMLAATNEQVARINDTVQAVRQARDELGPGAGYRLPGGRHTRFHVGDLVLIRRNDRHQQAVAGDAVLNGYRGVVTALTDHGVQVHWRDPAAGPDADLSTAVLSPGYIAQGGLELGYALTAHKAEGLTVGAEWDRPDGTRNHGSVLVYAPGLDNPGLYVSASRDKGAVMLFGARAELEGEREDLIYGPPASQTELTDRVIAALAEHATATAETANDRPVLVDLGHAPADPDGVADAAAASATEVAELAAEWGQLRLAQTRARGDATALQEARERLQEFEQRVGAERMAEVRQHRRQRAARWLAEREARDAAQTAAQEQAEAWRQRPHGQLTDTELAAEVETTGQREHSARAAGERAAAQLAELEPQVQAGAGPHAQQVDRRLAELRRTAELVAELERLRRDHQRHDTDAGAAARQAQLAARAAETTPWYRPGRRAEHQRSAEQLTAASQAARDQASHLQPRVADLAAQLGDDRHHNAFAAQARARQAEASYPADRDQAHGADQTAVNALRRDITASAATAQSAAGRVAQLRTEQRYRADMPADQRGREDTNRLHWRLEQVRQRAQQRPQRTSEPHRHWDTSPHHGPTPGRGPSIGP